jgi:hypothetical protein
MLKEEYVSLLEEKPWQEMEEYFNRLPVAEIKSITTLDINTQDWIQFTVDNFDLAQQKWEVPKEHYSEIANKWATINNKIGRDKHNTFELNFGMNADTNAQLKEILGDKNISKLNADPDSILIRLIVKFPGHGVAWHLDDAKSYAMKFEQKNNASIKRLWWSIDEWKDGHAMQISKTMLTHYNKGEVFEIPIGLGHASSNFGYCPQYTVSFTGNIND